MDEVLNNHDIEQLYCGGLFRYKNDVVKIREYHAGMFTYYNLRTKKAVAAMVPYQSFKPITERIGMVNVGKACILLVRNTLRNYNISICPANLFVDYLPIPYPLGMDRTASTLKRLESTELLAALNNDYPSLGAAYANAIEWKSGCAFDKQFAIRYDGYIIYKNNLVGKYVDGAIMFQSEFRYLNALLENNFEKTSRTYRPTPING
jgi:hypothetical protein